MENSAQVHEAAAVWLAKRDCGEWTPEDEAKLEAWLNESTGNRVAFIRLESAWREADRIGMLGVGVKPGVIPPRDDSKRRRWHFAAQHLASAASIAVFAVAIGVAAYFWSERSPAYSTPIGGLASVPIPDGSEITLNTNSEVRVHVSDAERRIDLKQGEAFFNVAKDPTRPFVVQAGNTRVIALGTRFSVWRNGKDVRVVVSEGRVRLENRDNRDADTASSALTAGTIARTRDAKVAVQKRSVAEVEELLSWRSGLVVFKETPLAQAAMELNRYNTRKLIVEDEAIAGFRIGGTFRATNLDAFVRLLKQGFAIDAEEQEGRIVLTEKL